MFLRNPATFICILIDYSRIFRVDSLKWEIKSQHTRSTAFSHRMFDRNSIRGREMNAQSVYKFALIQLSGRAYLNVSTEAKGKLSNRFFFSTIA